MITFIKVREIKKNINTGGKEIFENVNSDKNKSKNFVYKNHTIKKHKSLYNFLPVLKILDIITEIFYLENQRIKKLNVENFFVKKFLIYNL